MSRRAGRADPRAGGDAPRTALTTAKIQEHYDTIFRECTADGFCRAAFPDLRQRFIDLLEALTEEPLVFDRPLVANDALRARFSLVERIVSAFFASFGLFNNAAARGGHAAALPQVIEAAEARDTDRLRDLLRRGPAEPEA